MLTPGPMVGRSEECRRLDELLAVVRANQSRTLVIIGEPGVGKTDLLKYAINAALDFRVARAVGVESEMELAYAALHQLCAPMLDRLERLPEPQREALAIALGLSAGAAPDRFLLGLAVLGLLSEAAADRPLLCVVDDAQWVDRASAQILAFVARRVSAESVGILFATRHPSDELQRLPTMNLGGLERGAALQLLRSVVSSPLDDRVRERIIAETHGNPLALLELPRGLTAMDLAGGFGLMEAHALTGRIEESFVRRLEALPDETRRLLLVAAAEPVGDPLLLLRACEQLGIWISAADLEPDGLLELGERVTFRHPLVRSAVYRSASVQERRAVHLALAEVTDREADPDRRAWHLAAAAAGPDERVALELERSAIRAQARGGVAATAAFLQRAVELTLDPAKRVERALAAAQASLYAGAFDAGLRLLATAEAGATDEFQRARVELLRAEIAFASGHGGAAPASLLRAAKRIEPFDATLARASYLEALSAAMFAARLAGPGSGVREVALAVQAAAPASGPRTGADLLLDGWAALFAAGCAAATPRLREALTAFDAPVAASDLLQLLWLVMATALTIWDDGRWELHTRQYVELARSSGTLSELPLALNSRAYLHLFSGELQTAGALIEEARVAIEATRANLTPWAAVALEVLRGDERHAGTMLDAGTADASQRGEGISLTVVAWARAILYNSLGAYDKALAAAREAINCPTNSAAAAWGMVELIEAAARVGEPEAAGETAHRFKEIADAAGTDWALGVNARSQALLSTGAAAEQLYREGLEHLGRGRMRVDLARVHLLYGEWLRRENRRLDARAQLRAAHDQFTSMGLEAFAERSGRELLATGEKVRKRTVETRDDLTAQERHIADLVRVGLSNPEIGARLFLSPRTVEWHLRHVFAKLGVRSRRELASAKAGVP
jgi:DNA-binding CsgD family transcriptional regulator/tetratricopeptide (TPR) repeat protein